MANVPGATGLSSALRVVTVGTGTCGPRLDRRGPCVLVQGAGATVAVDLGLGALHGLLGAGVAHGDLDAVFLTHLHPDHTAELVALLFAANYDESPRRRPLTLVGGAGTGAFLAALEGAYGGWIDPKGYARRIRQLEPGEELAVGGLTCQTGLVRHLPSSLAYRFQANGRSVVVSGDTGFAPELARLARGVDLLLVEASLPASGGCDVHLTAREAGLLARQAGVGRLVLTHLYPSADADDPAPRAAQAFGAPVDVAYDGMEIEV
ncbi:MAG: hypothetical protein Kow0092_33560 [Deferrisomatales bacterium]